MGLNSIMDNEDSSFTADDIEEEWNNTIKEQKSWMMMGVYGAEGTAKTGVCLDAISEEEIQNGSKMAVIDIDDSARPIWKDCLGSPSHVRIFKPIVTEDDDIDFTSTYHHIISTLIWLKENARERNIKYVVLDGIDTFLKWCEFKMKIEFHGGEFVENKDIRYNWGKRNRMYYRAIRLLKDIPAHAIITSHMKADTTFEENKNGNKEMVTTISGANWHSGKQQDTADELYQIVHMKKRENKRGIYKNQRYIGEVEKWKGNARMEGKQFLVLKNKIDTESNECEEIKWHGLIGKLREHNQKHLEKQEEETKGTIDEEFESDDDNEIEVEVKDELLDDDEVEEIQKEDIVENNSIESELTENEDEESDDDEDENEPSDDDDWFSEEFG